MKIVKSYLLSFFIFIFSFQLHSQTGLELIKQVI